LQASLGTLTEVAAIRDAAGNMIGIYKPWEIAEAEFYEQAKNLFDPIELERLAQCKEKGFTIEEVMRHLKSLERDE
jgi:hypothetical protein